MSFNRQEQRYRDLWSAVSVLKEGVATIRQRGRKRIDLELAIKEKENLLSEKKQLELQGKEINDRNALKISKKIERNSRALSQNREKQECLKKQIEELDDEVKEYMLYTDSFNNLTYEEFYYLMSHRQREYDIFEAIVFLSINEGMDTKEREKVIQDLRKRYEDFNIFYQDDIREAYIRYVGSRFH